MRRRRDVERLNPARSSRGLAEEAKTRAQGRRLRFPGACATRSMRRGVCRSTPWGLMVDRHPAAADPRRAGRCDFFPGEELRDLCPARDGRIPPGGGEGTSRQSRSRRRRTACRARDDYQGVAWTSIRHDHDGAAVGQRPRHRRVGSCGAGRGETIPPRAPARAGHEWSLHRYESCGCPSVRGSSSGISDISRQLTQSCPVRPRGPHLPWRRCEPGAEVPRPATKAVPLSPPWGTGALGGTPLPQAGPAEGSRPRARIRTHRASPLEQGFLVGVTVDRSTSDGRATRTARARPCAGVGVSPRRESRRAAVSRHRERVFTRLRRTDEERQLLLLVARREVRVTTKDQCRGAIVPGELLVGDRELVVRHRCHVDARALDVDATGAPDTHLQRERLRRSLTGPDSTSNASIWVRAGGARSAIGAVFKLLLAGQPLFDTGVAGTTAVARLVALSVPSRFLAVTAARSVWPPSLPAPCTCLRSRRRC